MDVESVGSKRKTISDSPLRDDLVLSVVENRAREVCTCRMNMNNLARMIVSLSIDGHSYNETLLFLQDLSPKEILLHDGSRDSVLTRKIIAEFQTRAAIIFINRQYFDQDRGAELLKKVVVGKVDSDIIAKYTVLSSSYCLLRYVESCNALNFASCSLSVHFESESNERMFIDRRTAINLELVSSTRGGEQKDSLFGVVNKTKTSVGARLLRSDILRPLTTITTIEARQRTVEALLRNETGFSIVRRFLHNYPDMDRTLGGLAGNPKQVSSASARRDIDTLLFVLSSLKTSKELSSAIVEYFPDSPETLLSTISENLWNFELSQIVNKTSRLISDCETVLSAQSPLQLRFQECFAIKPGVDGLLDVARKTYLQTVEELYQLADAYTQSLGESVRVSMSTTRGFFLVLPSSITTTQPLPCSFIQAVQHKKTIACTTVEFKCLSDRAMECISQALIITSQIVQDLKDSIRDDMDTLFTLVDSVALLDMLVSFVDLALEDQRPFTSPNITAHGNLVIQDGRHPIVSAFCQKNTAPFVTNDIELTPIDTLRVITGPNGSGKTIYIKQIALIVILAQIGCYVPAVTATVPIRSRILSRIGTTDDMENNLSTFAVEMAETAYILNNVSSDSLVIIDELGRGTSNIDGLALAFSLGEAMVFSGAWALFVTHFPQVTLLHELYFPVENIHLQTIVDADNQDAALHFAFKVSYGPSDLDSGYGLTVASAAAFPRRILDATRQKRNTFKGRYNLTLCERRKRGDCWRLLLQHLIKIFEESKDETRLRFWLQDLKVRWVEREKPTSW